jgi:hypothetical protein
MKILDDAIAESRGLALMRAFEAAKRIADSTTGEVAADARAVIAELQALGTSLETEIKANERRGTCRCCGGTR